MTDQPGRRLGIVLVNWKGWADTIECLESIFKSDDDVRVAVVDNGSGDGSIEHIVEWARGDRPAAVASPAMARFSTPAASKPIDAEVVAAGTDAGADAGAATSAARLTVIDGGANIGFAAGNNLGLRHFARDPSIDYFWLLNNDTVIDANAIAALVSRMDATHNVGMCGTVIRYYHRPDQIQSLNGGRFSVLTGTSRHIGRDQPSTFPFDPARVARETHYVLGASLAVSRRFLEVVGLMEESYFLYFEEIDWAFRSNGRFATAFAHGAIVYHKEGGSIGSSGAKGQRSTTSEYYLLRSRLAFIRRRQPLLLPVHWTLAVG